MRKIKKGEWVQLFTIYGMFYLLLLIISPKVGHGWDSECWKSWMNFSYVNGIENIYESSTDYLPLYNYVLFVFAKFQGSVENINKYWHFLKAITLLFEMAISFFIFKLSYRKTQNFEKSFIHSFFYLLNIFVLYNSIVWGQVDGIFTFFILMSIYYAFKKNITVTFILFLIALNFKLQAIIFLPIIGLILLSEIVKKKNFIKIIIGIGVSCFIQFIIVLPFIINGTFQNVLNVVFGSFHKFPVVSMQAFNFWHLVLNGNLMTMKDDLKLFGLTYKNWGLLMFFLSSFLALFLFIKQNIKYIFYKISLNLSFEKITIVAALIPLLFFYFNTEMHERYSHPAFPFLAILAIIYKKPIPYIVGSIAYFLNLEKALLYLDFPKYSIFIFQPYVISFLYLFVIVQLFLLLYNFNIFKIKKSINE